jgi:hypothetical protein
VGVNDIFLQVGGFAGVIVSRWRDISRAMMSAAMSVRAMAAGSGARVAGGETRRRQDAKGGRFFLDRMDRMRVGMDGMGFGFFEQRRREDRRREDRREGEFGR